MLEVRRAHLSFYFGRGEGMANRTRVVTARQRKHWHSVIGVRQALTGAGTTILGSFVAGGDEPFTVLRILGELTIVGNSAGVVAGDACSVTLGIGVVSADAIAAGAGSMPDPSAEPDYDWLWWYPVNMAFEFASASVAWSNSGSARIRIESKAMRKVGSRHGLVWLTEYVNEVGNPPIDVQGTFRFLVGTS